MELTKPSGLVSQSVLLLCGVDTVLCLGISVLSTYSYHPFISTTIYPKILSNLSCYMEHLNLSVLLMSDPQEFATRPRSVQRWEGLSGLPVPVASGSAAHLQVKFVASSFPQS